MRKILTVALVCALALTTGCQGININVDGNQDPTSASQSSVSISVEPVSVEVSATESSQGEGAATSSDAGKQETPEVNASELVWRYEIKKEKNEGEYKTDEGTVLVTTSYEYPVLAAVCDSDATAAVPEDIQKKLDAFNSRIKEYVGSMDTAESISASAKEHYNAMDEENRKNFPTYCQETTVGFNRVTENLVEVELNGYGYWGGAHGGSSIDHFHFDLQDGKFVEFGDLTDYPAELWDEISMEVVNQIYRADEQDMYFDTLWEGVYNKQHKNFAIGEGGITVFFDEYEIAPYAAGIPAFEVSYDKLLRFTNDRAKRLFEPTIQDEILAQYYDALEYWFWFEGAAPVDYNSLWEDNNDMRAPYYAFDYRDIKTMDDFKALLKTRFSDQLVKERLDRGLFKEFNGRLYVIPVGRGTDETIEYVDYDVDYKEDAPDGNIIVHLHRCDWDDDGNRVSTGQVDDVKIPFVMTSSGIWFEYFPTLW